MAAFLPWLFIFAGAALLLAPAFVAFSRYGWWDIESLDRFMFDMDLRRYFIVRLVVQLGLATGLLGWFMLLVMRLR